MKVQRNALFLDFADQNLLTVSQAGYVVTDETWVQKPLPSPFSRLYYVMEGTGMLVSEREEMKLEAGYVYLAPCGSTCGYYGTDSVRKLFFHVNFILPDGYDLFAGCEQFARLKMSVEHMETMRSRYFGEDAVGHAMLKGELWRTVTDFAAMLISGSSRRVKHSSVVDQAIGYIRRNLSAGLSVSEVAGGIYCSESTLCASFRREMGITPAQYIEDLVIFEAGQQLMFTSRSVGEISAALGYCDQFYFSRRFRKRYGISPREYRKQRLGI